MSTLKVTNIESPSGGGVNAKITDINGGQLANRNLIYNGAMTVSQRGTSGSTTSGGSYPSLDRWSCNDGGIADFTVSQSTDAPGGFANSAKWACTTTGSPTNDAFHEQKLEGQDIQHLEHGTSSAKSLTISFWVKSNKTGEYSLWIENNDANRYFTTPGYTINTANTWEFKTITVPGDTAGSGFSNDNGVSLKIRWHLVCVPLSKALLLVLGQQVLQSEDRAVMSTLPTVQVMNGTLPVFRQKLATSPQRSSTEALAMSLLGVSVTLKSRSASDGQGVVIIY